MLNENKWFKPIAIYSDIRVLRILVLGFSAGLPILLIFSTLSLWLKSAGVERSTITLFSWAGLAYGFKFLWAPLMDRVSIPILVNVLGHRKSWLAITQILIILALSSMFFVDPKSNLTLMACIIVLIGVSSASQDAIVDTYRIESAPNNMQSVMSSSYIIGYRLGMITSGAGSLLLASHLGADEKIYNSFPWQLTYLLMGCIQIIGLVCCLVSPEPVGKRNLLNESSEKIKLLFVFIIGILGVILVYNFFPILNFDDPFLKSMFKAVNLFFALFVGYCSFLIFIKFKFIEKKTILNTFWDPIDKLVKTYGKITLWILIIIGTYRISDIVLGVVANLFYAEKGYTLNEIATFSKFWGLLATLLGGVLGGVLSTRFNIYNILLLGALLSSMTNILFSLLSILDTNTFYLCMVIIADNISGGIASVAFVAFLSSLTDREFTTSQFALFSSIMLFFPKIIGGYSGVFVDLIGYNYFFISTAIMGLPVIILILYLKNIIYKLD